MAKLLNIINKQILFFGISFLLLFIPLYPKFPLFSVSGTYVSIRLEDVFVAIVVAIFGLKLLVSRDFSIIKMKVTKLIILYFSIGLLSILSGIFITKNIVPHLALLHLLRRMEYISLFFVAYYSIKEIKQLKWLGWLILVATLGIIIYGLGQKYFGWPVISTMNKEFSKGIILRLTWWARINSTFAGHYDLAAYLVMILSLSFSAFIVAKKFIQKVFIGTLGTLSYYLMILTASRISFAAYIVSGSFIIWTARKRWWLVPFLALSLLGMVFSDDLGQRYAATFKIDLSFMSGKVFFKDSDLAMISTITPTATPTPTVIPGPTLVLPPGQRGRKVTPTPTPTPEQVATDSGYYIEPTILATGRSTDIRLKVEWPRAILAFCKNPLLGTGYSSITLATDNDYLRMLGETGLLGALAFLAIVLEMARKIYFFVYSEKVRVIEKIIILGVAGAAIGYFLNAMFIDVFEASKIAFFFWIMMGIALKIIDLNLKSDTKT